MDGPRTAGLPPVAAVIALGALALVACPEPRPDDSAAGTPILDPALVARSAAAPPPGPPPPAMDCGAASPTCPPPFRCTPAGTCAWETEVYVPAGPFLMGCSLAQDSRCQVDEAPPRTLELPAFAIDRTEVTVAAYALCVEAGACTVPRCIFDSEHPHRHRCNWSRPDAQTHPINGVDWAQARAYCAFVGRRLPSEAEWEKAARGPHGRIHPWGGDRPIPGGPIRANVADEAAGLRYGWRVIEGYDDGYAGSAPVGSFPDAVGPYGTLDQIGNVWEWTEDMYPLPAGMPPAPDADRARIIKGGGYANYSHFLRAAYRGSVLPIRTRTAFGFRCARSLGP